MSGTLPQTGTTPSSSTQSSPLSGGAIPQASGTPSSTTTTTLPTDRLDTLDQALSQLRASQADHNKLLVKQASDASSLSDRIDHLDQKWETFADLLSNDIKKDRKKNDAALAALKDSISQLQDLLKAQLADNRWKDNSRGSGLGNVWLTQSLLTTETLPTFHGKPSEDPNIFLTSFNHSATTTGWSHQDYILHFEGQLRDNANVVHHFLEQERTKGGVLLTPTEAKTQLLNCFRHRDRATTKIVKLGNLRMNVDESVDAWNLWMRAALREAFLTDFSKTQVLKKFVAGAVPDLKDKFLQREDIVNMADALNLARDWEG